MKNSNTKISKQIHEETEEKRKEKGISKKGESGRKGERHKVYSDVFSDLNKGTDVEKCHYNSPTELAKTTANLLKRSTGVYVSQVPTHGSKLFMLLQSLLHHSTRI
jgi:hypothetical protein